MASHADNIVRMTDFFYRSGLKTVEAILDCSLYVLYSVHKNIPLGIRYTQTAEDFKDADLEIYYTLRQNVQTHLTKVSIDYGFNNWFRQFRLDFLNDTIALNVEVYQQALSFLFQYCYERYRRNVDEYWQPAGLSFILSEILNAHNVKSVYNPFAGTAAIMRNLAKDTTYLGQEINPKQILYAQILKDAYRCDNATIMLGDSLTQWQKHFDAIVANVPWNMPVKSETRKENTETYFLRKASIDARLSVGIYPVSILSRPSEGSLRKQLVDKDFIESIIFLPPKLFANTNISACIIITNKHKKRLGEVQFVDATKIVRENFNKLNQLDVRTILSQLNEQSDTEYVRWVKSVVIHNNDYNLAIGRYIGQKIIIPEGYKLYSIKDICSVIRKKTRTEGEGRVVRMKDLSDDAIDITRVVDDFPVEKFNKGCNIIGQDALLLGTVSRLKPTYYFSGKKEIYLKSNVIALSVDESIVSIPYLVGELNKEYVKEQIYEAGGIVPHISLNNILNIQVLIPSLIRQESEVSAKLSNLRKESDESLQRKYNDFLNEVHQRKHDVMTYVHNLKCNIDNLFLYSRNLSDQQLKADIQETLEAMRNDYRLMYQQLEHFADEDVFGVPEELDLISFFRERGNGTPQYEISLEVNEDHFPIDAQALVYIAPIDLEYLTSNIIGNAVKHGFTNKDCNDYKIKINISADFKSDRYIIDFCNNGSPYPSHIDKMSYGLPTYTAGPYAGEGKGGHRVKKICEHYNGDYNIGHYQDDDQLWPYVQIILPIFHKDE